jgi:predicted patatin/cPLA2 family phospholipase
MLSKYEKLQKEQIRLQNKIESLEKLQNALRLRSAMYWEVSKAIKELSEELSYLKINRQKLHKGFIKTVKAFFA